MGVARIFSGGHFSKINKKIAKNALFFPKEFNQPCVNFSRVWTKNANCSKFFNGFLGKIAKMHYFSIFFKKFINHALIFRAFEGKTQFVGNSEKIFLRILLKMHYFCIFSQTFSKPI